VDPTGPRKYKPARAEKNAYLCGKTRGKLCAGKNAAAACRCGARQLLAPPPHAACRRCRRRAQAEAAGDTCGKWDVSPTLQPESPSKNL